MWLKAAGFGRVAEFKTLREATDTSHLRYEVKYADAQSTLLALGATISCRGGAIAFQRRFEWYAEWPLEHRRAKARAELNAEQAEHAAVAEIRRREEVALQVLATLPPEVVEESSQPASAPENTRKRKPNRPRRGTTPMDTDLTGGAQGRTPSLPGERTTPSTQGPTAPSAPSSPTRRPLWWGSPPASPLLFGRSASPPATAVGFTQGKVTVI